MSSMRCPISQHLPDDLYAVIEIPAQSGPVKYEMDKTSGMMIVDRFMSTTMFYPANYGFIPNTLSEDGDPIDVLVLTPHPLVSGAVIRCRPVALLDMKDESGQDEKLIAVAHSQLTTAYQDIQEHSDLPKLLCDQIEHFFSQYKALEPNKWVKIEGWRSKEQAHQAIQEAAERFNHTQ